MTFKTTSDTETLLALLERFALEKVLPELRGMFAFLVYDHQKHQLLVCRDRAGEKPLYLATSNKWLAFSSDLSAFYSLPEFKKNISKAALQAYLQFGYVPHPNAIFEQCFKLSPGTYLKVDLSSYRSQACQRFNDVIEMKAVKYRSWWSYQSLLTQKPKMSFDEAKKSVKATLLESVGLQLISDVPVGCFLSGGIDSSLIASMIAKHNKPLTCFNIGFEFSDYDESKAAGAIAKHLGDITGISWLRNTPNGCF